MVCLDQQHSGREEQAVVAAVVEDLPIVVAVEDLPISDLDDFSSLDCICCLKDHNFAAAGLVLLLRRRSIINVYSIGFRMLIDSRLLQRRTKICMVISRRT